MTTTMTVICIAVIVIAMIWFITGLWLELIRKLERDNTLEECAATCDEHAKENDRLGSPNRACACRRIALDIRARKIHDIR